MQVADIVDLLIDGQVYEVRFQRGAPQHWPAWRQEQLFVQRHKGQVVIVTMKNTDWAEYDPRHHDVIVLNGNLHFAAEDYWMEIKLTSIDPNLEEG